MPRRWVVSRQCPLGRRGTQRARGEIFKLSLPTGQRESHGCEVRMQLVGDGAAVASCPMRRGGGVLLDAARRWRLARCGAAVASCPMRCGGGVLPYAARRWPLARCGAAVASCRWLRCHLSSNVLRTDSEGWGVSKFQKCRARCGESRTNVEKCSELAWTHDRRGSVVVWALMNGRVKSEVDVSVNEV